MGLEPEMEWMLKRYNTNMDPEMELTPQNCPPFDTHMVIKTLDGSTFKNV